MHAFRSGLFGSLIVGALLASGCRTTAGPPAGLDNWLQDLHERGLFDGAVVVGDQHSVLYERAFGYANVEHDVRLTADTPVDGGSLAKTFTAALLIDFSNDGILGLDQPAQRYLPELPYPDVTLRHLLSHSSGIPVRDYDYFDKSLPPPHVRTTETLLQVIEKERPPLMFVPGSAFSYSSFGFDLAALAASRAAKLPYAELLKRRLFDPLRITSAFARPGKLSDFAGVRTLGYRRVDGKLELHDVFDLEEFHGGSNIYISARDLHRWNSSFFARSPFSSEELAALLQPAQIAGNRSGLTLGSWYASPDRSAFWYSGHLQGFHSEVFRDVRRKRSIVYVSNNTIEPFLWKAIVRGVNQSLDGNPLSRYVPPATDAVPRDQRASLAGRWQTGSGEIVQIESSPTRLDLVREGLKYEIVPIGPLAFYVPGIDVILGFSRSSDGSFSKIYVSSNIDEQWGARTRE